MTALSSDDIILNFSQLSVLTPVVLPSSINIPLTTMRDVRAQCANPVARLGCFHLDIRLAVAIEIISWMTLCQFLTRLIFAFIVHGFIDFYGQKKSLGHQALLLCYKGHTIALTPVVNLITCVSLSPKKDIQRLQKMANPLLPWKFIPTANHPKYYTTNTGLGLIKLSPLWIRVSWWIDFDA